jgi:hypothetical protein
MLNVVPRRLSIFVLCLVALSSVTALAAAPGAGDHPAGRSRFAWQGEMTPTVSTPIAVTLTATDTETTVEATATDEVLEATATAVPMVITAVEPDRLNTLTGGVLTVLGHGFTPATVIRLVGYGLLPTTVVNSNALTGMVPAGVPPGRYDVQVGVGEPDGLTAIQAGALLVEAPPQPTSTPEPTATPVPTATPTPTATAVFVFGQPQLTIQSAQTTPAVLRPGEPFELLLEVANLGNWTAVDATIEMQSPELAIPATGSNVRVLARFAPGAVVTTTLSLVVHETAPKGPQNLSFQLRYFDISGRSYGGSQSVGLVIGESAPTPTPTATASPAQSLLLLSTYHVEPEATLQPGATFELVLSIANVGDEATGNVVMRLGGEGARALEPFVLLNSGNVRFVETLAPGETIRVAQRMLVAGTAAAGVYNLPIDFTYRDPQGQERIDSQVINLLVQRPPLLQVNFYRPVGLAMVGQRLDLPVEVVNIGRSLINVSTVTLSSPAATIENHTVYIGPLDGGTSGSVDGLAVPTQEGDLNLNVTVQYLDEFNQPQSYEATLRVAGFEAPPLPEDGPGAPGPLSERNGQPNDQEDFTALLWRFLKGLLGLGS